MAFRPGGLALSEPAVPGWDLRLGRPAARGRGAFQPSPAGRLTRPASRHGVPRSQVQTPLSAIACQFVAEGCGVTIADPFNAASFAAQGLVARPFTPAVSFNFGVIDPTHVARPQLVTQFVLAARGFTPSPT